MFLALAIFAFLDGLPADPAEVFYGIIASPNLRASPVHRAHQIKHIHVLKEYPHLLPESWIEVIAIKMALEYTLNLIDR